MFRKIDVNKRLPEKGKWVTTVDAEGNHRVCRLTETLAWNMRDPNGTNSPPDNLPILYWLEEVVLDSQTISAGAKEWFDMYSHYSFDWESFCEAWVVGRMELGFGKGNNNPHPGRAVWGDVKEDGK